MLFSGHEVPGEGEHKVMSYIRDLQAHPEYDPSLRHVIYGRDSGHTPAPAPAPAPARPRCICTQ